MAKDKRYPDSSVEIQRWRIKGKVGIKKSQLWRLGVDGSETGRRASGQARSRPLLLGRSVWSNSQLSGSNLLEALQQVNARL